LLFDGLEEKKREGEGAGLEKSGRSGNVSSSGTRKRALKEGFLFWVAFC